MSFHPDFDRLPLVVDIDRGDLFQNGQPCGQIENRPGQAGSLRIYLAVADAEGVIDPAAAGRALALYGTYADEARAHPGSHPNIDRLLALIEGDGRLTLQTRSPAP